MKQRIFLFALGAAMTITGAYELGKHEANRWWQKQPFPGRIKLSPEVRLESYEVTSNERSQVILEIITCPGASQYGQRLCDVNPSTRRVL